MTTLVYQAKGALITRLTALAQPAQPLAGIQVAYAFPGFAGLRLDCVYGGGVRFSHEDAVAERGVLISEMSLVSLYIRVTRKPSVPVEETDARAAVIFGQIAGQLVAQPHLAGPMSFAGIAQGQGDYEILPDNSQSASILAVQVRVETDLSYGAG
ncbi:hypothetical protein [Micromonospora sp. NPDC004551]|uniref:hypothetical protein n=1 Tax=Micromonospora sp. NPDC004551 TaxID=3154284 RepID=UPI0033AB7E05